MEDKNIVFKNNVGLYEKELKEAQDAYVKQIREVNAGEIQLAMAQEKLNKKSIQTINEGLAGTNQQQRDAQLAFICAEERTEVESRSLELSVIKHNTEVAASALSVARLNIQFIIAAMNAGFIVGIAPTLDQQAEEFSQKFK